MSGKLSPLARRLTQLEKKRQAGIDAAVDAALLCDEHHEPRPTWVKKALDSPHPRKPFPDEAQELDRLLLSFKTGIGFALFEAIELCFVQGWEIPSWAVVALLHGNKRFRAKEVAQLGDAFAVTPHAKASVSKRNARHKRPSLEDAAAIGIYGTAEDVARHILLNSFPAGRKPNTADFRLVSDRLTSLGFALEWPTVKRIWQETRK